MLAGREVALRLRLHELDSTKVWPMVLGDLGKATLGLVISVLLVVFLVLGRRPRIGRLVRLRYRQSTARTK